MSTLSFDELGLSPEMLHCVRELGYEQPTAIQAQAIPLMLQGRDMVGQSQTGSGKTAAFCIPAIERIDAALKKPQMLVLCPTRELAVQVAEEARKLSMNHPGIEPLAIYGGQSYRPQIDGIKRGAQIIIGTPGRVLDHLRKGTLSLETVKYAVLDEADRMLDMGFAEEIEEALRQLPENSQRVFFSATMPAQIRRMIDRYSDNPESVQVAAKQLSVDTVEQVYFEVRPKSRTEVLARLLRLHNVQLGLIFCNTKAEVDTVTEELLNRGFLADRLHGDLSQMQRDRVMNAFRKRHIHILVATDIAARGIDVDNVEAVFNIGLPRDLDDYVHRIGRTGRAGRSGIAFTLLTGRAISRVGQVKRVTGANFVRRHVPALEEVSAAMNDRFYGKLFERIREGAVGDRSAEMERLLESGFEPEALVAALLDEVLGNPKTQGVGQRIREDDRDARTHRHEPEQRGAMTRLFMSAGSSMNIRPADIVGAICGETGISPQAVGEIDIYPKHLFVDVDTELLPLVFEKMQGVRIKGRQVNIEEAGPRRSQNARQARRRVRERRDGPRKPRRKNK